MKINFAPEVLLHSLKKIAAEYDPASEAYLSVELAAKAVLFIHATQQQASFRAYLHQAEQELSDEERSLLASLGLD